MMKLLLILPCKHLGMTGTLSIVEFDKTLTEQAGELVKISFTHMTVFSWLSIENTESYVQAASGLFVFVSSDDRLLSVAKSENMSAENPLSIRLYEQDSIDQNAKCGLPTHLPSRFIPKAYHRLPSYAMPHKF
ncbi:MAG: hypothetical protein R2941_20390 [Desulfobacterales bacterium]